jgi:serine/threonine protein kinase
MPSQFAQRDGQSHVSVRSQSMLETFEIGRRSFVNEARLLARFDHPALLKVHRFWEANGTAYMAMPYLLGRNLREARKEQPTPPPEAWLRSVIDPVLGGLAALHAQNVWHRDVAPDNIFMPADGSPAILLDFGAARQAIGDRTQSFTAILKPNYAPIEQYAEAQTLRQGAWTDIYAMAAVIHTLMTGKPPPPATTRALHDDYQNPVAEGYSEGLLAGLEWGLRVAPQDRPQSVAEWREVLDGRKPAPPRSNAPLRPKPPRDDFEATVVVPSPAAAPVRPPAPQASPAAGTPAAVASPKAAPAPVAQPGKSRLPLLLAGVAGVVVLGGAAWMFGRPKAEPDLPAVALPASSPSLTATAPASSPSPASTPASTVALAPAPAPSPVAAPAPAPSAPASAARRPEPASAPAKPAPKPSAPNAGKLNEPGNKPAPSPVIAVPTPTAPSPVALPPSHSPAPSNKPLAVAPPEPTVPAGPRTPREACGKRVFLAMAMCIDEQCQKPEFRNQDECVKLREIRERQQRNNP